MTFADRLSHHKTEKARLIKLKKDADEKQKKKDKADREARIDAAAGLVQSLAQEMGEKNYSFLVVDRGDLEKSYKNSPSESDGWVQVESSMSLVNDLPIIYFIARTHKDGYEFVKNDGEETWSRQNMYNFSTKCDSLDVLLDLAAEAVA